MSAAEVIEQIKSLPATERREVVAFIHSLDATEESDAGNVRHVDRETFAKVKAAVFKKHDEVLRKLAQ
jgi:hypothetical protein